MNTKRNMSQRAFLLAFTALMVGCQDPTPTVGPPTNDNGSPNNATIAPNGTTSALDLSDLAYATRVPYGSSNGHDVPMTLCEFLTPEDDFVGLVEIVSLSQLQSSPTCADKEYVGAHYDIDVRPVAAAAGNVATGISAVLIGMFFERLPEVGETHLVSMRKSADEWFLLQDLVAAPAGDYTPASDERPVDLPRDFTVLSAQAKAIIADYAAECPELADRQVASDDEFAVHIRTPNCGTPVPDDAGIDPPDVTVGRD